MKNIYLDLTTMVLTNGSTKGAQPKYYKDGFWYKQNMFGYEGLSEHLASVVLKNSNAKNMLLINSVK